MNLACLYNCAIFFKNQHGQCIGLQQQPVLTQDIHQSAKTNFSLDIAALFDHFDCKHLNWPYDPTNDYIQVTGGG